MIEMRDMKQFATSSNGDTWYLARDDETQKPFVLHRANVPSGGHETSTAVDVFLNTRPYGPEREALLAVLGVGDDEEDTAQETYRPSAI
jgi:hypothetical protein